MAIPAVRFEVSQFAATLELDDCCAHVCVRGEIDIATRDVLSQTAIGALRLPTIRQVVLDLALVTFLDASGLGSLVTIRNASHDNAKHLSLSNVPAQVSRLLTLTNMVAHFTVAPPDGSSPAGAHRIVQRGDAYATALVVSSVPQPADHIDRTERLAMMKPPSDQRADHTNTPPGGRRKAPTDQAAGDDPGATSHPTGQKQAAENAETEPAG